MKVTHLANDVALFSINAFWNFSPSSGLICRYFDALAAYCFRFFLFLFKVLFNGLISAYSCPYRDVAG